MDATDSPLVALEPQRHHAIPTNTPTNRPCYALLPPLAPNSASNLPTNQPISLRLKSLGPDLDTFLTDRHLGPPNARRPNATFKRFHSQYLSNPVDPAAYSYPPPTDAPLPPAPTLPPDTTPAPPLLSALLLNLKDPPPHPQDRHH